MKEQPNGFEFLRPCPAVLKACQANSSLCVGSYLNEYLKRTKSLKTSVTKLFISFIKPFKQVSREPFPLRGIRIHMKHSNHTAQDLRQLSKLMLLVLLFMKYNPLPGGHPQGVLTFFTVKQLGNPVLHLP